MDQDGPKLMVLLDFQVCTTLASLESFLVLGSHFGNSYQVFTLTEQALTRGTGPDTGQLLAQR